MLLSHNTRKAHRCFDVFQLLFLATGVAGHAGASAHRPVVKDIKPGPACAMILLQEMAVTSALEHWLMYSNVYRKSVPQVRGIPGWVGGGYSYI